MNINDFRASQNLDEMGKHTRFLPEMGQKLDLELA